MKINADTYITDILNYRLSNIGYGIVVLSSVLLFAYSYLETSNFLNETILYISLFLFAIGMIVGRLARLLSGNYYWHHITEPIEFKDNGFELEKKVYDFDNVKLLKFKVGEFERSEPFLYKHILKDKRNMIKIKTQKNFIQVHFKTETESEHDKLRELKKKITEKIL